MANQVIRVECPTCGWGFRNLDALAVADAFTGIGCDRGRGCQPFGFVRCAGCRQFRPAQQTESIWPAGYQF